MEILLMKVHPIWMVITFIVFFIIGFNFDKIIRVFKSLINKKKRVLCTKDLFMKSGEKSFTKNKKYEIISVEKDNSGVIYHVELIDNVGEEHGVDTDNWLKDFKYSIDLIDNSLTK